MQETGFNRWVEGLLKEANNWLGKEAERVEGGYRCKQCRTDIMGRPVFCSVHDSPFEFCAGSGRVHKFVIPECPTEGCVNHRPSFWDSNLRLDGDTLRGPCIHPD